MCGLLLLGCLLIGLSGAKLVYRTPTRTGRSNDGGFDLQLQDILPDPLKAATDLIEVTGMIAETHEVITEDGYILQAHRLPSSKLNLNRVVVLLHGIAGSSDNWMLYHEKSLPQMLQKEGYDVWLGSSRGSVYSRRHVNYKEGDERFWDYSVHEIGLYDVSAFIDLALNVTGAQKVFLIGHSRGTTTSYILLSSRPEYNDKVKLMVSYAPVAYCKHGTSALLSVLIREWTVPKAKMFGEYTSIRGMFRITGTGMRATRVLLCNVLYIAEQICYRIVAMILGRDYLNDLSMFPTIMAHIPDGISTIELLHFMQIAQTDNFRPYDYGSESKNQAMYNSTSPIDYDLSKITVPISFHYSVADKFIGVKDVMKLIKQVPNVAGVFEVPYKKFNHINFIVGSKSDELLYKPTIAFMKTFLTPALDNEEGRNATLIT